MITDRRLLITFLLVALLPVYTTGCVSSKTPEIYSASPEQLLGPFREGKAQLKKLGMTSGYSVASAELLGRQDTKALYDTGRWEQLAIRVMKINSGSDLAWFYLGRAAEELVLPDAAAIYFQKSIEEASPKGVSGCLGDACMGFEFPEESQRRLAALRNRSP